MVLELFAAARPRPPHGGLGGGAAAAGLTLAGSLQPCHRRPASSGWFWLVPAGSGWSWCIRPWQGWSLAGLWPTPWGGPTSLHACLSGPGGVQLQARPGHRRPPKPPPPAVGAPGSCPQPRTGQATRRAAWVWPFRGGHCSSPGRACSPGPCGSPTTPCRSERGAPVESTSPHALVSPCVHAPTPPPVCPTGPRLAWSSLVGKLRLRGAGSWGTATQTS